MCHYIHLCRSRPRTLLAAFVRLSNPAMAANSVRLPPPFVVESPLEKLFRSSLVTFGHVWSRLVTFGHVWSRLVTFPRRQPQPFALNSQPRPKPTSRSDFGPVLDRF